jgi:hypothetical protein
MRYVNRGCGVSRICLGMMSCGDPRSWEWMLREDANAAGLRRSSCSHGCSEDPR